MIDQDLTYKSIIAVLDSNHSEYKLFSHRPALTYEDLEAVRKDTGFFGTEGKCMVLKADDGFVVYVTIFSKKLNFDKIKGILHTKKARLASKEELMEYFGAEPGCAYPFGFGNDVPIYVDPDIYLQDWFLFSPLFPTKTIQIKGSDLKNIFNSLSNEIIETKEFS